MSLPLSFSLNVSSILLKEKKEKYLELRAANSVKPLNELHQIILRVEQRKRKFDLFYGLTKKERQKYQWILSFMEPPLSFAEKNIISNNPVECLSLKETFNYLDELPVTYLYVSDYKFYPQGFDMIVDDRKGKILLCESKGTTSRIKKPADYLSSQTRKGRQLSWEWCWNSLLELTSTPFGCDLFLRIYPQFIRRDNLERLLLVTQGKKRNEGYAALDTNVFNEDQISKVREQEFKFKKMQNDLLKIERLQRLDVIKAPKL